jgi:tRNA pseudouridine55 synthase
MSRRKSGKPVHGIVLLDKPAGQTSNRALQTVRKLFDARKAGHTGSLDPFATGMLPICLGEASKTAAFMIDSDKTYRATARLGVQTETGDIEGAVINESAVPVLTNNMVLETFSRFTGEIEQVPPMYSALKHQGQPLYKLARQGKTVERKPRKCHIYRLELLSLGPHTFEFEVECSKGTYVRTLAEDLAADLGSCAHLEALRRSVVQPFDPDAMVTLEELERDSSGGDLQRHLLPVDSGLVRWPLVTLDKSRSVRFRHGNPVECNADTKGWVRVNGPDQKPLGLAECTAGGVLKPRRVYVPDQPQGGFPLPGRHEETPEK